MNKPIRSLRIIGLIAGLALLGACGGAESPGPATTSPATTPEDSAASTKPSPVSDQSDTSRSPGKPGAPITFRYQVQGTPIVGQPVAINVFVSSSMSNAPISVSYRVNDASAMSFPESQALRSEITNAPGDAPVIQQITVIPLKEGRLYLNVSAEIQTENGTMIKSQAIPVQVGSAPRELQKNGTLKETEDGEGVISMPSD